MLMSKMEGKNFSWWVSEWNWLLTLAFPAFKAWTQNLAKLQTPNI